MLTAACALSRLECRPVCCSHSPAVGWQGHKGISLFSVVRQKDRCWLQVSCHFIRVWFWRCDKRHMLGCKSVCNRQDVSKSAAISFNGVLPPANATVALLQFAPSPYKLHLWRMAARTRYHVVWMHCDWKTFVRKWKCLLYMSYKTYYLAVIFSV